MKWFTIIIWCISLNELNDEFKIDCGGPIPLNKNAILSWELYINDSEMNQSLFRCFSLFQSFNSKKIYFRLVRVIFAISCFPRITLQLKFDDAPKRNLFIFILISCLRLISFILFSSYSTRCRSPTPEIITAYFYLFKILLLARLNNNIFRIIWCVTMGMESTCTIHWMDQNGNNNNIRDDIILIWSSSK